MHTLSFPESSCVGRFVGFEKLALRASSYNRAMKTHFDERFGFLISDVGRLVGKRFDDLARLSIDLTRAQCRALAYLSFYGDINQARLADLT